MPSHPDPEIARILDRNAAAYNAAVQAPPAEIADDPVAYLRWLRGERPAAPAARRPAPRTYVEHAPKWGTPAPLPRQRHPRPGPVGTAAVNAERNRQLNALAALIKAQGGQIPDTTEARRRSWPVPTPEDLADPE